MIGIVTDSTCDLSEDLVQQYGIIIVPQYVIWGDRQYRDRLDITPAEFYERLESDPQYPSSSQAGVSDFLQAFELAIHRGATEVIALTVSSAMSGAYQTALNAAALIKTPVSVVDSKGPTMTLGWQVLAAARAAASGSDLQSILIMLEGLRKKLVQFVAMDSIKYLKFGGRIGNAIKWAGSMLNVQPLVYINHGTGLVEPFSLFRSRKTIVDTMYNRFFEHLQGGKKLHVAVLHGNCLDEAEQLAQRIVNEFNPAELLINMTGPVLGINTGPRALALSGYAEE